MKPPVLHMPNKTGRFHLYSDTSKFANLQCIISNYRVVTPNSSHMQVKDSLRQQKIIPSQNWSWCGLAINIPSFAHLLKRADFDAIVDHLALTHTIKRKAEPAITRIKRLLELISSYSFNLYYTKVRI